MKNLTEKTSRTQFRMVGLYSDSNNIAFYSPNMFDTYEGAVKDWETTCRDRNKGDEYDSYWNNVPCVILEEKVERTLLIP